MKDSDWIVIFRLKEFNNYFTASELIQLSLSCKRFRSCLTPTIFNTFKFAYFVNTGNYKSCIIPSDNHDKKDSMYYLRSPGNILSINISESIHQFQLDLKLFPSQSKELELHDAETYYYLLYDVPNVFTKLTTIIISNSRIQHEIFQYLLDNLKLLDTLELSDSHLMKHARINDKIFINLPSSLKRLKAINNNVNYILHKETSTSIRASRIPYLPTGCIYFSLKHIPKLITFEYKPFSAQSKHENLRKFLKLNTQIMNLKIKIHNLLPELLSAITNINNLKFLYLDFMYDEIEIEYYNLPALNSVTFLNIHLYYNSVIDDRIFEKFPNLTDLFVEMHCSTLDMLFAFTKKATGIKNLSLKIYLDSLWFTNLSFPKLDCLKSLEFILSSYTQFNNISWDVNSCPNLKLVKFIKDQDEAYNATFDQPELNLELVGTWNVVYFPHKITYYRIF